jgi:AcrR family transcriptional regulator
MIKAKNKRNGELLEMKQRQICLGAMKVFRKKKFHAASMREIAEATGMSMGNLYHYIDKKEDILVLIYQDLLKRIRECFEAVIRSHESPVDQLVEVVRSLFSLACRMKEETLVILTEARSLGRKDLHELLRQEANVVSAIEEIIKRGVARRMFRCSKPHLMSNLIAYNIWIVPLRGWNIRPRHGEKEVVDQIIQCFLGELGVPGNPRRKKS